MQTHIALNADTRDKVSQVLNTILADENVLYIKLRNYHWNVRGIHFTQLHELFEQQYNELLPVIDEIAERTRMVGRFAIGSMKSFLSHTRLEEANSNELGASEMIDDLLKTNEAMIRNIRADIEVVSEECNDEGTADLLIATLRMHEKMAWMLRSLAA